jgi:DNA-binding MarR family transcriptional regulator
VNARSILTLNQRTILAELIAQDGTTDWHELRERHPAINRTEVTINSLIRRGLIKKERDSWGTVFSITPEGKELMA